MVKVNFPKSIFGKANVEILAIKNKIFIIYFFQDAKESENSKVKLFLLRFHSSCNSFGKTAL